jgi:hypothetical protein
MRSLLKKYFLLCPTSVQISKLDLKFKGYDHLAIRSLEKNYYDSVKFQEIVKESKFEKMDDIYEFPKYNVNATWYKQKSAMVPRIFASWHNQDLSKFSVEIQNKIVENKELTFNEYLDVYNKNQYVAWTYIFGQDINHVAFEVEDIEHTTEYLILKKYKFNSEGGIYKISKDKNLIQTSIMADEIEYNFSDKKERVPYSFVEFVQRKNDRDGFETESANKIFSSTTK